MIKFFPNFSLKILNKDILGLKFKDFSYCTKVCILINSKVLISSMTIAFQNYSPRFSLSLFVVIP